MNQKNYKAIRKKMVNNIKIIYGNKSINDELNRIAKTNPYLADIAKKMKNDLLSKFSSYTINENSDFIKKRNNSLSDYLLSILADYSLENGRGKRKEEIKKAKKYFYKILTHKDEDIFDRICRKNKYNPRIWRDFFILRFLGLKIEQAYDCIDNIIYHNYLPKPIIEKDKIIIEINELTTQDDIKMIWKEIEKVQCDFENINSFKNQKREFITFSRGKKITEQMEGNLDYIDFSEKRQKTGYKKNGNYDHDEENTYKYKIKKNFKEKYINR